MSETLKSRFNKYDNERSNILKRARMCAEVTIPSLMPEADFTENDSLKTPFQGLGARAVNNLAAKITDTLMPTNTPFFRIIVDENLIQELMQTMGAEDYKTKVENKLSMLEKSIKQYVESSALRVPVSRAVKLLVSTGNALCYLPKDEGMRVFRLDQYICRRDSYGNVLEIITRERIAKDALDEELQNIVKDAGESSTDNSIHKDSNEFELYTCVKLNASGKYDVWQEIVETEIESSRGTYKKDDLPFIALRWTYVDGEDYGRGHVEEYLGDLISFESLTENIVESSAIASTVKFAVKPNGVTDIEDVRNASNGDCFVGVVDDISCIQLNKANDLNITFQTSKMIEDRISQAFLLNSSVQRNAERVTAEEIKYVAGELESALGGIYGILTQEFQQPLLRVIMNKMKREKKLPPLPDDSVRFVITTGLEALGRGQDLNKLMSFMSTLASLGPQVLMQYVNISDFITRVGTSIGIDMDGLVKTKEQIQQEQQQAMMQQAAMQVGPDVIKQAVDAGLQSQNSTKME